MTTTLDLAHAILAAEPPDWPPGGGPPVDPAPEPTIAELLATSSAAHQRYRAAVTSERGNGLTALREAAVARSKAETRDPAHTDPAWQTNGGTNRYGMETQDALNDPLLQFYADQLGVTAAV